MRALKVNIEHRAMSPHAIACLTFTQGVKAHDQIFVKTKYELKKLS